MAVEISNTTTPFPPTTKGQMDEEEQIRNTIIGIMLLVAAILGCFVAVLALGKDFFTGKFAPAVIVGALTWVDFWGAISSSAFIFHGFVRGEGWLAGPLQCSLQVSSSVPRGEYSYI